MKIKEIDLFNKQIHQQAVDIIVEYSKELDIDLCFQNFDTELNDLTKLYAPPTGAAFFLLDGQNTVGFIALKKLEKDIAEIKRLYIKPEFRKLGWGEKMSLAAIKKAKELEYTKVKLDTLKRRMGAKELYLKMGFKEIKPYNANPHEDVLFFEIDL